MMPASIAAQGETEVFADETARLRRAAAAAVARTPGLFAAVLYGSRARGDHRPDSDWDVALVAAGRDRAEIRAAARALRSALPGSDVSVLPLAARELRRKANALGNIASAIVRDGKVLAGAWRRPRARGAPTMEAEEYRAFVTDAIGRLERAARALADLPHPLYAGANATLCKHVIADSADGAEFLVKAMLGRIVGAFPRTHNLRTLGDSFAEARPVLRDAVCALDGESTADHAIGYDPAPEPDDMRRAGVRLAGAARLLTGELTEAANAGPLSEAARVLAQFAAGSFAAAAEAIVRADTAAEAPVDDPLVESAIMQRGAAGEALAEAAAALRTLAPPREGRA